MLSIKRHHLDMLSVLCTLLLVFVHISFDMGLSLFSNKAGALPLCESCVVMYRLLVYLLAALSILAAVWYSFDVSRGTEPRAAQRILLIIPIILLIALSLTFWLTERLGARFMAYEPDAGRATIVNITLPVAVILVGLMTHDLQLVKLLAIFHVVAVVLSRLLGVYAGTYVLNLGGLIEPLFLTISYIVGVLIVSHFSEQRTTIRAIAIFFVLGSVFIASGPLSYLANYWPRFPVPNRFSIALASLQPPLVVWVLVLAGLLIMLWALRKLRTSRDNSLFGYQSWLLIIVISGVFTAAYLGPPYLPGDGSFLAWAGQRVPDSAWGVFLPLSGFTASLSASLAYLVVLLSLARQELFTA